MTTVKSRRKLSNLVVDRGSLARLSVPFLIMAVASFAIVFLVRWKVIEALEQTRLTGPENLTAMNTLLDLQRTVTNYGTIGLVLLVLLCLALWVAYSHRIFGPTIPVRRHIQKLIEGDYSSRISIRSGDELKSVIEDLNHLAEVLEQKK